MRAASAAAACAQGWLTMQAWLAEPWGGTPGKGGGTGRVGSGRWEGREAGKGSGAGGGAMRAPRRGPARAEAILEVSSQYASAVTCAMSVPLGPPRPLPLKGGSADAFGAGTPYCGRAAAASASEACMPLPAALR